MAVSSEAYLLKVIGVFCPLIWGQEINPENYLRGRLEEGFLASIFLKFTAQVQC